MTVRHMLLAAGAVLVLGMAIYLVREVSKAPADAQARGDDTPPPQPPPPPPAPAESAEPSRQARIPPSTRVAVERGATLHAPDPATQPALPSTSDDTAALVKLANPKLDAVMAEANRAYDRGDFDEAKEIAQKVLAREPGNVRMLRIIVSAECIAGDATVAQQYFTQLPAPDRAQMRTRCDRYGVTFKDP